jgi:hypothetical protein
LVNRQWIDGNLCGIQRLMDFAFARMIWAAFDYLPHSARQRISRTLLRQEDLAQWQSRAQFWPAGRSAGLAADGVGAVVVAGRL